MATPSYLGAGQPVSEGGGWLGSWLGGTPAYKGAAQAAQRSSMFGVAAPAYKPGPAMASTQAPVTACVVPSADGPGPIAILIPREVIEQQ